MTQNTTSDLQKTSEGVKEYACNCSYLPVHLEALCLRRGSYLSISKRGLGDGEHAQLDLYSFHCS